MIHPVRALPSTLNVDQSLSHPRKLSNHRRRLGPPERVVSDPRSSPSVLALYFVPDRTVTTLDIWRVLSEL